MGAHVMIAAMKTPGMRHSNRHTIPASSLILASQGKRNVFARGMRFLTKLVSAASRCPPMLSPARQSPVELLHIDIKKLVYIQGVRPASRVTARSTATRALAGTRRTWRATTTLACPPRGYCSTRQANWVPCLRQAVAYCASLGVRIYRAWANASRALRAASGSGRHPRFVSPHRFRHLTVRGSGRAHIAPDGSRAVSPITL